MTAIFITILVLTLLFGIVLHKVFQVNPSKSKVIPGLKASLDGSGNLDEIGKAGSLHEFLLELHKKFGNIAGFWIGTSYIVSISTPDLFKEHQNVFDRPPQLFQLFEPLIGSKSIQYANGDDGRYRRKYLDRCMSFQAMHLYLTEFHQVALEVSQCFAKSEQISHPICSYMANFALKAGLLTMFGDVQDDQRVSTFYEDYQILWSEMENRLTGSMPKSGSKREINFKKALENCQQFVKDVVTRRKASRQCEESFKDQKLIDVLMDISPDDETLLSDAITYVVGGFHTTANSLAWCIYYLSTNIDVQKKLQSEIDEKTITDNIFNPLVVSNMPYLQQVFNETLRCSVLAPWAARFQDKPTTLGGFQIPEETPVIHALGVSLQNPEYWPNPDVFDPTRFSVENTKSRPKLCFQPFGFAGKRICPGYRFAFFEAAVCLIVILQRFTLSLDNCTGDIQRVYGLVTHPSSEVMVRIKKRC